MHGEQVEQLKTSVSARLKKAEDKYQDIEALQNGATLHPQPSPLHPTPFTLHPTPYTLHPTPCTLHPISQTLNAKAASRRDEWADESHSEDRGRDERAQLGSPAP